MKGIAPSYLSKNGFLMRIVVFRNAGLDLLEGLKDDTHNDDDRSSTKGNTCVEDTVENERDHHDDQQTDCSDKYCVIQNACQIISRGLARTDARNEAALFLDIVCNLDRVEGDRCVEICEENTKGYINHKSDTVYRLLRITPVGRIQRPQNLSANSRTAVHTGEACDNARHLHQG